VKVDDGDRSNVDMTLASYDLAIDAYLSASPGTPSEEYLQFRRAVVAALPPNARMLELGSGPGHDAVFFESVGVDVHRTDGAKSFIDRLHANGFQAKLLDITTDEFGGPFDVVFANAVLLHLTTPQFDLALARAGRAVTSNGVLAFTVKEGDGDAWSLAKLAQPRYFNYWREPELRSRLVAAGWQPTSVENVQGRLEEWLHVICRRAQ
jgi:predicted TPR repeat methyltransferase